MSAADPHDPKTTHFGFREVPEHEKAGLVGDVFRSVAGKYDLMNDLMSLGLHRLWKDFTVARSGVRPGQRVLDVAGGTGDLAARFARRVGTSGLVVLADINEAMLERGRARLIDAGFAATVACVQADAESLPFAEDFFDCVAIGFGLRNVTHMEGALRSMYRVLAPGGRLLVLEFSRPANGALRAFYDAYSFTVLPRLGALVAGDEASYRYLAESIRRHPDQEALKAMIERSGFERVRYYNLSGGIVALHTGCKS